jgi:hypothetical protein
MSQESTTGYKEAYDLGYQVRTRSASAFDFFKPSDTYMSSDTPNFTPMAHHSLVGQTFTPVSFRLPKISFEVSLVKLQRIWDWSFQSTQQDPLKHCSIRSRLVINVLSLLMEMVGLNVSLLKISADDLC